METGTIDINKLSAKDRKALMAQLTAENKAAENHRKNQIGMFKNMTDELVKEIAPSLADFGEMQTNVVNSTFKDFEALLALKNDLYGKRENQASHTFTDRSGNGSITIGYNEIIGFDGTQTAGVSMIKEVIAGLSADDENREVLADLLNTFMKPDKKGNLNPTRIAELESKKDKVNKPLFSEGVDIIVKAQFKTRSSMFVRGWTLGKNAAGADIKIQFSITAQ